MKKPAEIPEHLKKVWDEYRVLKSRSDHFGYNALLINGYPNPLDEDKERMWEYHQKHIEFYLQSCGILTQEFLDAYWRNDGSCVLSDGVELVY